MVVDQPARLHERVADRRADEPEAAPLELLAHRLGGRRSRPAARPAAVQWFCTGDPVDERSTGRPPGRRARATPWRCRPPRSTLARLRTMPGSARQRSTSSSPKAATTAGSKPAKHRAVALALVQDRRPRQPGLGALEDQELEQPPGVALAARPTRCRGSRRTPVVGRRPSRSAHAARSSTSRSSPACRPRPRPRRPSRRGAPTPRPSSGPGGGRRRPRRRPSLNSANVPMSVRKHSVLTTSVSAAPASARRSARLAHRLRRLGRDAALDDRAVVHAALAGHDDEVAGADERACTDRAACSSRRTLPIVGIA